VTNSDIKVSVNRIELFVDGNENVQKDRRLIAQKAQKARAS